jgi:serine/threonine protein kinase
MAKEGIVALLPIA